MARTPSNMLPLGTTAPDFNLPDTTKENKPTSFMDIRGNKGTVVMFICNHCPFVVHIDREIVDLANDYEAQGIAFVAISSNDVANYPDDSPDKMRLIAKVLQFPFPYLYDESQTVAKEYDAACTPDFYAFDENDALVYRGQLDESRPGNGVPVTGKDLRSALDLLVAGKPIPTDQYPSIGCNIKWKK